MKIMPLVSVAIITYNQKEFLKLAIESVLLQDYKPIEIVVGDDCSTDGTQQMLKVYQQKYPGTFIIKLSEKNDGITSNSNAVHFACTGKYIAWLGGDDLMLPTKITKQVAFLESNPDFNIVYHNLDAFDSQTGKHLYFFNSRNSPHTGNITQLIKYGTFNGACATMIRRSASPANGFDERIPVASDWLYWVEHLSRGGKIGYINEVLGRYRKHEKNVSNPNSEKAPQGNIDTFETCNILLQRYPEYKKIIDYRLSVFYRTLRKYDYKMNLLQSLKYNLFNIPSFIMLSVYFLSFKKIKL